MTTAQIIVLALIAVFALLSMASMLTRPRDDRDTLIKAISAALITAKETGRTAFIDFKRDGSIQIVVGASEEDPEDDDEPVQDGD